MTVSSYVWPILEKLDCCCMYLEKTFDVCKSKRFQITRDMQSLLTSVCNKRFLCCYERYTWKFLISFILCYLYLFCSTFSSKFLNNRKTLQFLNKIHGSCSRSYFELVRQFVQYIISTLNLKVV